MSRPVRITIAEPSEIIRRGLAGILREMRSCHAEVSEISDIAQFKASFAWQRPDILIVNPSVVGAFSLAHLRKEAVNPDMKCVALQTSLTDSAALREYDEVLSVYDGAAQVSSKLTRLVSEPEKRSETLSQREKEVVACVVKGMTNKQIADALCLSAHTVITHRRNISAKLDIHSPAGLTIYAIVNKLIELDDIGDGASSEEVL